MRCYHELQRSVDARLARAGIQVLTRISYLAYSTEIAQAMLRRQQLALLSPLERLLMVQLEW